MDHWLKQGSLNKAHTQKKNKTNYTLTRKLTAVWMLKITKKPINMIRVISALSYECWYIPMCLMLLYIMLQKFRKQFCGSQKITIAFTYKNCWLKIKAYSISKHECNKMKHSPTNMTSIITAEVKYVWTIIKSKLSYCSMHWSPHDCQKSHHILHRRQCHVGLLISLVD
jgi:hypothetical protein